MTELEKPEKLEELVLTPDERARGVQVDRVVFTMDWTGEDHPGQLAAFVAGRLRAFGTEPAGIDTDAVRRAAEDDPTLRRGDLPVRQLDHLSAALADLGGTLLVWESGTDAYELLVALTGGREPAGLLHEGLPVRPWGSEPEQTLVSLNCPDCSQMLVWELPPTETLADEHCDCGTALFDAEGHPLPNVTLHP
ncbi:hypothetical protein ACFWP2_16150 [Kitasatospora sp. NPDC058444]|uniref:hypothetical protein n=1 Tax=Kitasatospora sp. NPDC058444 TaxID=3346504 RepID=UPI00366146D3